MTDNASARCIAVVGPGERASADAIADAESLGRLLAARGWITLCGGRDAGVMAAAARGARANGGLTIGLLPGTDRSDAAPMLTVAPPTGRGGGLDRAATRFRCVTCVEARGRCRPPVRGASSGHAARHPPARPRRW